MFGEKNTSSKAEHHFERWKKWKIHRSHPDKKEKQENQERGVTSPGAPGKSRRVGCVWVHPCACEGRRVSAGWGKERGKSLSLNFECIHVEYTCIIYWLSQRENDLGQNQENYGGHNVQCLGRHEGEGSGLSYVVRACQPEQWCGGLSRAGGTREAHDIVAGYVRDRGVWVILRRRTEKTCPGRIPWSQL